ncbi:DUF4240 domain-containing protein [Nonomuraea sp. bgisy101]|uniref:DUF4240 domain-containing protein n=1 Tax=Nonomuraea sp. bgisy101 TaxID=3413784 RepID=UPI003D763EBF
MDIDQFWQLIEQSHAETSTKAMRIDWLQGRVSELGAEDILDFQVWIEIMERRSSQWDLYAAFCNLLFEGSGDAFFGFQYWPIGQGRESFEMIVASPDRLSELNQVRVFRDAVIRGRGSRRKVTWSDDEYPSFEDLASVAYRAYASKDEMSSVSYEEVIYILRQRVDAKVDLGQYGIGVWGEQWDVDDRRELLRRLPMTAHCLGIS